MIDFVMLGNVFSSKGVGEASMACGTCAFFAVRDAITAARRDAGQMEPKEAAEFVLDSPATPELVRLCCADEYVEMAGIKTTRPVASL
jgi:xanthine dehydrogenase molybdopterin-binding subunit B